MPKETPHITKYSSNTVEAYQDRISVLAEGRPWTDLPIVKETPGSGAPAPNRKPPPPYSACAIPPSPHGVQVRQMVLELLLRAMWQIVVVCRVGDGAAGWVEEEGDEDTAMERDTNGSYRSTWWSQAWCSTKCFTHSKSCSFVYFIIYILS
jgi:hypothetical protein